MSLILDMQYANMVSPYVRNFRKKGRTFNFSCPFCGDSLKVKSKARGYLFPGKDRLVYKCHNCDIPASMSNVLKLLDSNLAAQYELDKFTEWKVDNPLKKNDDEISFEPPVFQKKIDKGLVKISTLPHNHPIKTYVNKRKIPTDLHYQLYFTPTFKKWSNSVVPGTYQDEKFDEPRLVIPLIDNNQNIMGYQGRSLKADSVAKYITLLLHENNHKIYGLNNADLNKLVYVFEGPIDSMFIPNSIAATGGRMDTSLADVGVSRDRSIIVYDNEPRNIHTIKKMKKALANHYRICIWPKYIHETDINDMILAGYSPERLVDIINTNSYSGLLGEIQLGDWRLVND